MRRLVTAVCSLALVACSESVGPDSISMTSAVALDARGFDALGYNRTARIFNGPADGADGVLDGTYHGWAMFANDHLKMKWTAGWDRGNRERWLKPPYDDAWLDNAWSGMAPGRSGSVWHYRFRWIGPCADYATLPSGGYCIWGQFEVLMDHGVDATTQTAHYWYARSTPAGYGH